MTNIMHIVMGRPLVAIVITTALKEEVLWSSKKST